MGPLPDNVPLVPADPQMTLRVDLERHAANGDTAMTLVRMTHANVPVEWAKDLTAYWAWTLERGDYDLDLSGARAAGYSN